MKVSKIFNEGLEERAADLRAKLVPPFLASMVLVIVFWFFKRLCTIRTGICWYALWNVLYHICRFAALAMLAVIVLLLIYVIANTIYGYFVNGRAVVFRKHGPSKNDATDDCDMGDLSMFK